MATTLAAARDAVNSAFRDHVVQGVPASGANEPSKSEVRHALNRLADLSADKADQADLDALSGEIANVASSVASGAGKGYATQALLAADLTAAAGAFSYVYADPDRSKNDLYVKVGAPGTGSHTKTGLYTDNVSALVTPLVEATQSRLGAISSALRDGEEPLNVASPDLVFAAGGGFFNYAVGLVGGVDLPVGRVVDAFDIDHEVLAGAASVTQKVWRRTTSDANTAGPGAAGDVLIDAVTLSVADLGLTPGAAVTRKVTYPLRAAFTVAPGQTYIVEWDARTAADAPTRLGVGIKNATGFSVARRGWYRSTGGAAFSIVGDGYAVATRAVAFTYANTVQVAADLDELKGSFEAYDRPIASRSINDAWDVGLGLNAWAFGVIAGTDVAVGSRIASATVSCQLPVGADKVRLTVWSRATGSAWADYGPGQVGDVSVSTQDVPVADLGLTPGGALTPATFRLASGLTVEAGRTYLFHFVALTGTSPVAMGFGANNNVTTATQAQRGWFGAGSNVPAPYAISWALGTVAYRTSAADNDIDTRDQIIECSAGTVGRVVTVSGVLRRQGVDTPFSGSVTLDAPAGGSITAEARTLTYVGDRGYGFAPPASRLTRANVSAVVVKDASTSAVLVAGTDYRLNAPHGLVTRFGTGADRAVKVDYAWTKRRYDLVCLNPETMALAVVKGTERDRDAAEFVPSPASSQIVLLNARVATGEVEAVPVWNIRDDVAAGSEAAVLADQRRNRSALRRVLGKLMRGEPVTIASYGDSILAQESAIGAAGSFNGAGRDRSNYYADAIASDVISAIPLFDTGDGAGQVHIRESKVWRAILALQSAYGSVITYKNFAIGGSTTATGSGNGLDPIHLNALIAAEPDLTFVGFGMNERGSGATEANTRLILEAIYAFGGDAYVLGVPRPNAESEQANIAGWRLTNRALRRAAEYVDPASGKSAAFHDTLRIYDDAFAGVMGLSTKDLSQANLLNHPGLREHRIEGRIILAGLSA